MKNTPRYDKKSTDKERDEMYEKFDLHEVPEFSISIPGYNRYEVDRYLVALVNEYICLFNENFEMKSELKKYRKEQPDISEPSEDGPTTGLGFDIEELIKDIRSRNGD